MWMCQDIIYCRTNQLLSIEIFPAPGSVPVHRCRGAEVHARFYRYLGCRNSTQPNCDINSIREKVPESIKPF